MDIQVPEDQVAGIFAIGASIHDGREVVTLDFIADVAPDRYQVVQRIRLTPSALEPLYLEIGDRLQARRDAEGQG